MGRIFITGDVHRDIDRAKFEEQNFSIQNELTKDDFVIVTGDMGIVWYGWENPNKLDIRDRQAIEWFNHKNFTTLFVDGNHENHDALSKFPEEVWNGGKVHRLADSVFHLQRGQVFDLYGKTFFTMGGAESVDRYGRVLGLSWWKNELPSKEEYEIAIENLRKHNMAVNYVITHDCDTSLIRLCSAYSFDANELNEFFRKLEFEYKLKFDKWYFGHHHIDKNLDSKHRCLYDDIIEIDINTQTV